MFKMLQVWTLLLSGKLDQNVCKISPSSLLNYWLPFNERK